MPMCCDDVCVFPQLELIKPQILNVVEIEEYLQRGAFCTTERSHQDRILIGHFA